MFATVIPIPDASIPDSDIVTAAPTFAVLVTNVVTIPVGALNVVISPVVASSDVTIPVGALSVVIFPVVASNVVTIPVSYTHLTLPTIYSV